MRRRILLGLPIALVASVVASVAFGFWSSTAASTASASTQTFGAPGTPQASVTGGASVAVSWTAAKLSDGTTAATGYYVTRTNIATSVTSNACGSFASPLPGSSLSCTDASAPAGTYTYAITAVYHSWTARSASTGQVTVTTGSVSLSPATGNVGTTTSVSGSGFAASSSVTIKYDGSTVATATTGTGGSFSGATFAVPASPAGAHTVTATVSGATSSATFTVTPHIALSPSSAVAGTSATITGTGFAAGKSVTASFGGAALTLTGGTTDSAGGFTASYTVPNQAPGAKTVSATDASSNNDSATFTIPTPSMTLSPATGHVGDAVSVSGSNFPAGSTLSATFAGSAATLGGTTSTGSTGSFSGATFAVPAATAGGKTVQLTAAGQSASATFTVTPAITLSPNNGFAGSSDAISGTGFAANSAITATFAGSAVTLSGTTTTNASGSFTGATYTAPSQPFGSKTVTVTDAASNSGSAAYALHQVAFVVDNPPATATAGTAFQLTLRATLDGATDTSYTGSHTLTITGPGTSPSGATPTLPSSGSFTSGSGTLSLTLVKAESLALNITDGTRSVSGPLQVNPGAAANLAWTSVVVSGGTLSNPCYFSCTNSGLSSNNTFVANVTRTDSSGNPVTNTGTAIAVTVTADVSGKGSVTSGSLSIPAGSATTSARVTLQSDNGNSFSDAFSAKSGGLASATATMTKP